MSYFKISFLGLSAFLALLIGRSANANPYLPLIEGAIATSSYRFQIKNDDKEVQNSNVNGTIRCIASNWEQRSGNKYLRYLTSYKDIPFMKEDATIWRREENGNVYLSSKQNGAFTETLELPSNVDIGSEWKYNDGVESLRKITAKVQFELANGEKLTDCVEVTRKVLKNESLMNVTDKTTYCRDRGSVRTLFMQPSPVGNYITETVQTSFSNTKTP